MSSDATVSRSDSLPLPGASGARPVIGQVLFGGPISGALVRDIRLANELATRGHVVHVWWAMDRPRQSGLLPQVRQHWLFSGMRYLATGRGAGPHPLRDRFGRGLAAVFKDRARAHYSQKYPAVLDRIMTGLTRFVCEGVERDGRLVRRLAREMEQAGVTHVLPMLSVLCPWVHAARKHMAHPPRTLVTFQGYELYANYARSIGLETRLYDRLREAVELSDFPAIAVSADYVERVAQDVGVPRERLTAIEPGVPAGRKMASREAHQVIAGFYGEYDPTTPMVTYLGRQDSEKGIDLLLYAATMLRRRGVSFQLFIGGPTLFGLEYYRMCRQISENLRLPVRWQKQVSEEVRTALMSVSACVVYPSIHREPFGMVAAEALSFGTPAVVPDYGGVAGAISAQGRSGGLLFRAFDSGDLAAKLEMLLTDGALREKLSSAGLAVAEHYSVKNMTDRVLRHMGVLDAARG